MYCNEQRLFKNFFSPVIKLVLKERVGGRIHRKYDKAKTPFQRLLESDIPEVKKQELREIYQSLNPAQLKRTIDKKLDALYQFYKQKNLGEKDDANIGGVGNNSLKANLKRKISVRFSKTHQTPVSVR